MKKIIAPLLILAAGAAMMASAPSASAQVSAQYHAEELAFRARQDEGSRLYEAYGPYSPQYLQWQMRETAIKGGGNPYFNNIYGQSQYYGNPYRTFRYNRYGYLY